MAPTRGTPPTRLRSFVRAADVQARDHARDFTARLIVSRRRQFSVALVCAVAAGLMVASAVRGADRARAVWSTCPTVPPTTVPSVPADWRVVALPRDMVAPQVRPGDVVDLVSQSVLMAGRAVVVSAATTDNGVNVAVPPDAAPTVATAAQSGDISLLVVGS